MVMKLCFAATVDLWHRRQSSFARLPPLLFGLALLAQPAQAEYLGQQATIDRPKLGLDMSYRLESEERTGPFIADTHDSEVVRESFDMETAGWLYHPEVAAYTLRLSPEWQQTHDQPDPGSEQRGDSFLLGYGLDATLLALKPYTLDLYARRQNSTLTSSLAPRSDSETDAYGASLNLKYRALPTILSYAHSVSDQTGFYDSDQDRDEFRLNMRHQRATNYTRLDASHVTQDRTSLGSTTNTENLFANLVNNAWFKPDNQVSLASVLTYRESQINTSTVGGLPLAETDDSGLTLAETLNWRHRPNFSTNYNLQYSQDEYDTLSVHRTLASAGMSHSLYENLVTTAAISGSGDSQGEDNLGGNLNFSYQRSIPGGTIFANIAQDYRVTNRALGGVDVREFDESHVLTTADITLLDNENVVLDSVVVTSADGSTVYRLGLDYTLQLIDISVRISRIPLGAIADGETVLVDYAYLSDPAFDDAVRSQSYGVGFYLWGAWHIAYRYSQSDQEFRGGTPPDVLNKDATHIVDTDLQWKWSTTRALFEDSDQTAGISLKRWRIEETLRFRPSSRTFLSASAYSGETTFKDSNSEETFYGFRTELQWQLAGSSRLRLDGLYNVVEGTSVDTVDRGASALWEWSYGVWRADASYRFLRQEDLNIDQTRNLRSVFLSLRRDLF
jgi:hypothetical protein